MSEISLYGDFVKQLYYRYSDVRSGARKYFKIPPSVMLNKYAYETNTAILEGVFTSPFSLYKRGVGKSVYCLKCLYHTYNRSVDEALGHIVFMPEEFLRIFKGAVDRNIRVNMVVWDDAGVWIGAGRWQSKFVKAVREFINVIRTHVVTLMVNAPRLREISRGIRENLDIVSFVRIAGFYFDLEKRRSVVYMYDVDYLELTRAAKRRTLPEPMITWSFRQYLDWYPLYEQKRKKYVEIGIKKTEEALKQISEEAARELEEIHRSYEPRPKDLAVEREVDLEELENEELEEGDEDGG